ncbi:NIPSNAP family protein [Serratia fonticola]|uniref:NIPSNAP family protein n=1 Tax=Serratia fonticola TaxID=47917 RepID=A0AAW3WRZ8_SERFO|nr:NIPSNAP family protein [Serratia fonticola]MBC3213784.1 NIPSNAP family protein [Serratia fonticola]NYA14735.1 NIPSNAP family protein [Serratia fonticola]NYA34663.1 NIPSNAP family protein [Serratia fonticola]
MKIVEILLYTLKPDTGHEFHQIMQDMSVPLHRNIGMDVVAYGNSLHAADSYYLIRVYDSLEHLEISQDEFYRSDAWRNGPREAIIERIMTSTKSVVILDNTTVNTLRRKQPNQQ